MIFDVYCAADGATSGETYVGDVYISLDIKRL